MRTIFAQASGLGRAGVAVLRLSGPDAFRIIEDMAGDLPPSHEARLRILRASDGSVLDQALVLPFAGPQSFTGENVVELHVHGSTAVVRAVLNELGKKPGARLAEPGEFTRRALENGRLDLTEVEGLADLIDAETEAQRKQAVQVMSGKLRHLVEGWRENLIRAAALIEATIDFADEDVPVDVTPEVLVLLDQVQAEVRAEIDGTQVAERIRDGFEVAIVGKPNVGKSTLLNELAGRDAAITSEVAGTTRDVVEVRMDLQGLPVMLLDTAGIRETSDVVERMGVDRAIERAKRADLRVFLLEAGDEPPITPMEDDLVLRAKGDLIAEVENAISGKTGLGVSKLISAVTSKLEKRSAGAGVATHERHRLSLEAAEDALLTGRALVAEGPARYDLAAEDLRYAIRHLEALVGRVDVEHLLDEIFASFCVGK